jgi:HPr kinase/phosphorylase
MRTVNIHATCLAVKGKGVLLLGGSGAGKSDLALRLIDEGAKLVADDRVELYLARGRLKADLSLAVKLDAETRLPDAAFYTPPLPGAAPLPLITLNPRLPSAPAKVRLALTAFARDLFRTDINPT